jgi:hypothetical protein
MYVLISSFSVKIEIHYRNIQSRINDLEPGKLKAYNELIAKQKDYHERAITAENKLNEINSKIKQ